MEASIKKSIRLKRPLPQWYIDEPVSTDFDWDLYDNYLIWFNQLSTTRRTDMGAIPWDVIVQHGDRLGLSAEESRFHVACIMTMDAVFLDYHQSKRNQERGNRRGRTAIPDRRDDPNQSGQTGRSSGRRNPK